MCIAGEDVSSARSAGKRRGAAQSPKAKVSSPAPLLEEEQSSGGEEEDDLELLEEELPVRRSNRCRKKRLF